MRGASLATVEDFQVDEQQTSQLIVLKKCVTGRKIVIYSKFGDPSSTRASYSFRCDDSGVIKGLNMWWERAIQRCTIEDRPCECDGLNLGGPRA